MFDPLLRLLGLARDDEHELRAALGDLVRLSVEIRDAVTVESEALEQIVFGEAEAALTTAAECADLATRLARLAARTRLNARHLRASATAPTLVAAKAIVPDAAARAARATEEAAAALEQFGAAALRLLAVVEDLPAARAAAVERASGVTLRAEHAAIVDGLAALDWPDAAPPSRS